MEDCIGKLLFESNNVFVSNVVLKGRVVLLNRVCPNVVNLCALEGWKGVS